METANKPESPAQQERLAEDLRTRVIESIRQQGFSVHSELGAKGNEKGFLRQIHEPKKIEQLIFHKQFLLKNLEIAKKFSANLNRITPRKIDLELREVKPESEESRLFFWWNLVWWSLPFDKPIGRQMKFILWDKGHNAPFGLIGLQSPPLRSPVRDRFLKLSAVETAYWINQSMYAQRVGALPPYNDLLGGKMVALSLVSNEIRDFYAKKYRDSQTLMRKKKIPNNLLFITTSSAYGKSSVYERIQYQGQKIGHFIGFTSGAGTFHIPEPLYRELLLFLKQNNKNTKLGYGTGSSRKLRLINEALRMLKIPKFSFHNIKRRYYFFPNVTNISEIIHDNAIPQWYDRPFLKLCEHWKIRWGLPRSERTSKWKSFDCNSFFEETATKIQGLHGTYKTAS